jgi:hypothetical protein
MEKQSLEDIDFLQEENEMKTIVELRKLVGENKSLSELLKDFEMLLTTGYTEDEALDVLKKQGRK